MSKTKTLRQQHESNSWIISMIVVVVIVVIAVALAIWSQHRELSDAAPRPTAIEYRVHH
jgi:heme/copper-type cytochrome/quinol oxidase subunit 2